MQVLAMVAMLVLIVPLSALLLALHQKFGG
jgi:hypothetical protein